MKFAVCNEIFGDMPWTEVCRFARQAGFDGVEVAPFIFGAPVTNVPAAKRAEIRRVAQDAGLEIPALHMLMSPPALGMHINSPDPAVRQKTVDYLKAIVDFARDVGAPRAIYGSPFSRNVAAPLTYAEARDLMRDSLRAALDHARVANVTICIEPLPADCTDLFTSVEGAFAFVRDVNHPNLGLMMDCKAASNDVRPVAKTVRLFAPYLRHIHANDTLGKAAGFGSLDFKPIMEALREVGYKDYVSLEPFQWQPDAPTVASVSLQYLKGFLK
jgi:sugar phosphate isomerase/epimerase